MRRSIRFKGWASWTAQAVLVAMVVATSLGTTGAMDAQARFEKIGRKIMCPCGCAQMLLECNHVGCPDSGPMRDDITRKVASGVSDAAILDGFVQEYGATVLAAPTTQGFDLVAWIMPFAVAGLALLGTILLVRNWAKNQPQPAVVRPTLTQLHDDAVMRERIRRETETDGGLEP